ncbi:MAG: hypothetical protein COB67_04410 [SAR324 cluster bacterium]|uniref:histidine kinase n=1 Tax=SAR324 cluster bacterium TaxID=2024889 RepID=A0A2A4T7P4_9DELT|nr:MAG: hypothetical protein COB67_04410 [SAR324 cluster bacterium]
MNEELDLDLASDFVIESKENLSIAEEDFLTMEQQGSEVDIELVNRTFRCVHSIKGGAGFLGLNNIGSLAHVMETLMDQLRKGQRLPDQKTINLLLEGIDLLNAMFDDVGESNSFDIQQVRQQIIDLSEIGVKGSSAPQASTSGSSPQQASKANEEVMDTKHFVSEAKINLRIVEECLSAFEQDDVAGIAWLGASLDSLNTIAQRNVSAEYSALITLTKNLQTLLSGLLDQSISSNQEIVEVFGTTLELLQVMLSDPGMSQSDSYLNTSKKLCQIIGLDKQAVSEQSSLVPSTPTVHVKRDELQETNSTDVAAERVIHPQRSQEKKKQEKKQTQATASNETIRVKVSLLNHLISLAGEMVLVRNQQLQLGDVPDPSKLRANTQRLDIVTTELQECVMQTRMQPVGILFNKFNRIVRDLGNKLGKEIHLEIAGSEVELDRTILEVLSDPLTHMIRNSCDHGLETPEMRRLNGKPEVGQLNLRAWHEGGQIHIEVRDDGRGIDTEIVKKSVLKKGLKTEEELSTMTEKELLHLIILPGFSTVEKVSDVSGRGVGMDVVRSNIERIGGSLDLDSAKGEGTAVRLRLPLTLAIIPCLVVRMDEHSYAIPRVNVEELVTLYNHDVSEKIELAHGKEIYRLRERLLPLLRLGEILDQPTPFLTQDHARVSTKYKEQQKQKLKEFEERRKLSKWGDEKFRQNITFAVLRAGAIQYGLIIDEVLGTEEIVVKSMHPYLRDLRCYAGSTVMGDGRVAQILDVMGIALHGNIKPERTDTLIDTEQKQAEDATQSILLFHSGVKEQFGISLNMVQRIERIDMSKVEEVGEQKFITIENMSYRLLFLENYLDVSPFDHEQDTFLLIPKVSKNIGIVISKIEDSLEYEIELSKDSVHQPGLLGSTLVKGRMTLFLDVYQLTDLADPNFTQQQQLVSTDGRKKRILLVEDISFFRMLVTGYLESAGYEVVSAENGKEAIQKFQKQEFDLIVSDLEMPVMNGFEFIRAIRNVLNNQKITALALTSLDGSEDKELAYQAGFNAYEVKIDKDQLLSAVNQLFDAM